MRLWSRGESNGQGPSDAASEAFDSAPEPAPGPEPPRFAPSLAGGGGGSGSSYLGAMPKLMGMPAYARPPRPVVTPAPRPFDPDDLPIEAHRTEDDLAQLQAAQVQGPGNGGSPYHGSTIQPSGGGLRAIAARFLKTGS